MVDSENLHFFKAKDVIHETVMELESATGWSLVQRNPTVGLYVWSRNPEKGGQRSILDYKRLWMNEWMNYGVGIDLYLILWD
jgi:hypothetical protein